MSNCDQIQETASSPASDQQDISIYLTDESKETLRSHLNKVGLKDYNFQSHIVLRRAADESSIYQFEPLFGERVAFRLKGIAEYSEIDRKLIVVSISFLLM